MSALKQICSKFLKLKKYIPTFNDLLVDRQDFENHTLILLQNPKTKILLSLNHPSNPLRRLSTFNERFLNVYFHRAKNIFVRTFFIFLRKTTDVSDEKTCHYLIHSNIHTLDILRTYTVKSAIVLQFINWSLHPRKNISVINVLVILTPFLIIPPKKNEGRMKGESSSQIGFIFFLLLKNYSPFLNQLKYVSNSMLVLYQIQEIIQLILKVMYLRILKTGSLLLQCTVNQVNSEIVNYPYLLQNPALSLEVKHEVAFHTSPSNISFHIIFSQLYKNRFCGLGQRPVVSDDIRSFRGTFDWLTAKC